MDKVIRDHLKSPLDYHLIYPELRTKLIKRRKIQANVLEIFLIYDISQLHFGMKRYINPTYFDESINLSSDILTSIFSVRNGVTILKTKKYTLVWDENRFLKKEKYYKDEDIIRKIYYTRYTKMVEYMGIVFVYDLNNFISNDDFTYDKTHHHTIKRIRKTLKDNIKHIFLYNNDGKINVFIPKKHIIRRYRSLSSYYKYNFDKFKEDAEGFRLDPRNYVPKYLDDLMK